MLTGASQTGWFILDLCKISFVLRTETNSVYFLNNQLFVYEIWDRSEQYLF